MKNTWTTLSARGILLGLLKFPLAKKKKKNELDISAAGFFTWSSHKVHVSGLEGELLYKPNASDKVPNTTCAHSLPNIQYEWTTLFPKTLPGAKQHSQS